MPKTKDYKKLSAKLQNEVTKLKEKLAHTYERGYEDAYQEMAKFRLAYDKHMEKAEDIFYKKLTGIAKAKKAKKKTASKAKTTKKASSKKKPAATSRKARTSK